MKIFRRRSFKEMVKRLKIEHYQPKSEPDHFHQSWIAFDPDLIPPSYLMKQENIEILEDDRSVNVTHGLTCP